MWTKSVYFPHQWEQFARRRGWGVTQPLPIASFLCFSKRGRAAFLGTQLWPPCTPAGN